MEKNNLEKRKMIYFEVDSEGNLIEESKKEVDKDNFYNKNLSYSYKDGVYVIDKGYGWLLDTDKSLVRAIDIPAGTTGS